MSYIEFGQRHMLGKIPGFLISTWENQIPSLNEEKQEGMLFKYL